LHVCLNGTLCPKKKKLGVYDREGVARLMAQVHIYICTYICIYICRERETGKERERERGCRSCHGAGVYKRTRTHTHTHFVFIFPHISSFFLIFMFPFILLVNSFSCIFFVSRASAATSLCVWRHALWLYLLSSLPTRPTWQ
jgi:hypothetical protein